MLEILRDGVWQFIGVVIGGVALILSFQLWKERQHKSLSYEYISNIPLLSVNDKITGKLQISFEGKNVEKVYLIEVKIINSGNVPIKSSDFERPLNLFFGEKAQVLSAEIIKTNPDNLQISINNQRTVVTIDRTLLNGGDFFTVKMLVSQFSGEKKDFKVDGRIIGIKNIQILDESKNENKILVRMGLVFIFIGIILNIIPIEISPWSKLFFITLAVIWSVVLFYITIVQIRKKASGE